MIDLLVEDTKWTDTDFSGERKRIDLSLYTG